MKKLGTLKVCECVCVLLMYFVVGLLIGKVSITAEFWLKNNFSKVETNKVREKDIDETVIAKKVMIIWLEIGDDLNIEEVT